MYKHMILFVSVILYLVPHAFGAAESDSSDAIIQSKGPLVVPEGLTIAPHVYGHFEAGQIVKGTSNQASAGNYSIDHIWTENAMIGLGFEAIYRERLQLILSLKAKLYFSYPMFPTNNIVTKYLRQDLVFDQGELKYSFGDPASPWLVIRTGYFPFKYNPDVRNLGEYMFRSGTYPAYIITYFDFPQSRLLGFHLRIELFNSLRQDLLFTTETFFFPTMNWSLAYLVNYDIANLGFIDIGVGVDFAHLLSVYTDHFNEKFGGNPTTPEMSDNSQFITDNGDTAYYTFRGIKTMARLSIDPKAFIPSDIFGESDLRLYAEACIIGVESYPEKNTFDIEVAPSYAHLFEKMPVAFGFYIPTFKILDELTMEWEWFGSRYLNDADRVMKSSSVPLPTYNPEIKENHWKWSVYLKKTLFNGHLALIGQIARDHMRIPCASYDFEVWQEMLPERDNWWWTVKTAWMF